MATITGIGAIVIWGIFALLGITFAVFRKKILFGNFGYKIFRVVIGKNKFIAKVYETLILIMGILTTIFAIFMAISEISNL